jgi:flagellar motor protein MotB
MLAENQTAHEEEDENYFISMTDMMVGILFIFIIMLMVFALNFRQKTDEQVNKLDIAEELAQQIEELQGRIGQEFALLNEADAARRRFLETLKDRLKVDGLAVEIDEANGILRLTEKAVRFAPDKSDLDPPAKANVQKIADALAETLPAFTQCPESMKCPASTEASRVETVFIEGHTDVTGLDDRNWQLSTERAVNTYRAIIETAPSLRKLRNGERREVLSVSGYSSTRPASIGQSKESHDLNRRIDLRFVMEANQRERLSEVSRLLREMKMKIQMLRAPSGKAGSGGWETNVQ